MVGKGKGNMKNIQKRIDHTINPFPLIFFRFPRSIR
jgi:hypothetical protein